MKFLLHYSKIYYGLLVFGLLFTLDLAAQEASFITPTIPDQLDNVEYALRIHFTKEKIKLDGELNEAAWQNGKATGKFWQNFPNDSLHASGQTEMYMTYDDVNLYIAVVCHSTGNNYVTPSLRRDYFFSGNDNISIHFDTYNDQTNSLLFGINPHGVRREAIISGGGRQGSDFNPSWDNKWDGNSKIYNDYWIGEYAIPFSTLRFKEGSTQWRFNAYRNDTQTGERSTWVRIPQNRIIMDMTYMGTLHWDKPLGKSGKNISLIPYVASSAARDFRDENQSGSDTDFSIGGDAKVAVTSALNLDLTINPDFSQVEVDQQVTNLDRFEIFFPERRQFFLENADLFSGFGPGSVNPFFSRRIGIAQDTAGNNVPNTILYGARLSGKLNERLRVGLINMQTAKQEANELPSFNYTVAAVEQNVFARSSVAAIFVNKQAINPSDFSNGDFANYNRVAGLEYRLASADNVWTGRASYFQAMTPEEEDQKFSHFLVMEYNKRRVRLEWSHILVGDEFDAAVGFVPRRDYALLSPEVQINFFPDTTSRITRHSLNLDSRWLYKLGGEDNDYVEDYGFLESQIDFQWNFSFRNTSRFSLSANYNNILLLSEFEPTRIDANEDNFLAPGVGYKFISFGIAYNADQRKVFNYEIRTNFGQFYSGTRFGVRGNIRYRYQPFGFISMNYNFNRIDLGGDFAVANIWLLGPRIDLTFSKKLFLTAFFQYNSQSNNLNINTRFQWRFAPVSDFFLVFTDNYDTVDDFSPYDRRVKNRAIVAKVTYWLNL
ncbi:MAG: DUF5916 domain-containing protein [Bacteroidota bacterium]